jgi:hypothetical protein
LELYFFQLPEEARRPLALKNTATQITRHSASTFECAL